MMTDYKSNLNPPAPNDKRNRACPACQADTSIQNIFCVSETKDFSYPGYEYAQCPSCRSIFLTNRFAEEDLIDFHRQFWGVGKIFQFRFAPEKTLIDRKKFWAEAYRDKFSALNVGKPLTGKLTLLDCGSGLGEFCSAASDAGFRAVGLEPNEDSVKQAQLAFPDAIFVNGNFEDLRLYMQKSDLPEQFDVIALHDVLEHVENPLNFLRVVESLMKPSGRLYVTIPIADHLQHEYLVKYSHNFIAPFHRTLFSKDGFKKALETAGLKILNSHDHSFIWGWTRGLAWQLGLADEYETLRKDPIFCKLDFAVDNLLEKISHDLGRGGEMFFEITKSAYYNTL
ncbi:hypothetical protein MTBLM1_70048 [Rhodospirillaceae bacterium LM-1]|nr:hypothetical protein MTBLM1_70048 [Rhodospirillaceae bacterium LM-1]